MRPAQNPSPLGFTLPELMIALCVLLLVTSTIVTMLSRQQRFYRGMDELLRVRTSLRDGVDILSSDLRTASVQDTIRLASDTAVEFYSVTGASTICADVSGNRIILPPDTLLSDVTLTAWASPPEAEDYAAVYVDSPSRDATPGWQRFPIASVSTLPAASACAPGGALPRAAELPASSRAYEVSLTANGLVDARRGTPVRFLRRVRYSVYRAGDGLWYLGYRRCGPTACVAIQPVSGPYASGGQPPLELTFFTSSGARIATPTSTIQAARIEILLRAASPGAVYVPGVGPGVLHDSLAATVAPRNGP